MLKAQLIPTVVLWTDSPQEGSPSLQGLAGCIQTYEESKKMVCHIQNAVLH